MTLHPFNNPKNIIYSHVIKIPTFGLRQTSCHHAQVLKSKMAVVCDQVSVKRTTWYGTTWPSTETWIRRYKPCIACIENINFVNECSLMHISLLASSSLS